MLQSHFVDVNGYQIHYKQGGEAFAENGTIVFLHGFPEYWQTWHAQLAHFGLSHRVIAPDMPGYNLSEKPQDDGFYQVPNLIQFWRSFITAINNGKPVILVAHDWGGAIAWPFTAFCADLVEKLVILNAGHPSTFTREMIRNPVQRQKSDYIHTLISDDAVEILSKDNYAYLQAIVFEQLNLAILTDEQKQGYIDAWSQPGAVQGMLRYYRSMPQLAAREGQTQTGPQMDTDNMKVPQIRITVPTKVLWGVQDKAFVPEILDGLDQYVPDLQVTRFEKASHWLQHEFPDEVNSEIDHFLRQ